MTIVHLCAAIVVSLWSGRSFECQISGSSQHLSGKQPWSVRIAESLLSTQTDTISYTGDPKKAKWAYEQGVVLEALRHLWAASRDQRYFALIKKNIDLYVAPNGSIRTYEHGAFTLDNILEGRQLLMLYQKTNEQRYRLAADTLRKQLAEQPRAPSGGFWHKKIYPDQMWLDGIYMAEPFLAEYALLFHEPSAFDEVARQVILIEKMTRDTVTGLLYHGWDESKQQQWANKQTGRSPNFWGRAMGWYAMGIVDVLDYFPLDHPKRAEMIAILQRLAAALAKYQDTRTGLWYQVVDQGNREGNYLEASASCMLTYAFAKGVRKGYLGEEFLGRAKESFLGLTKELVTINKDGSIDLRQICQVGGLGGNPYRDGSYEYYIREPQKVNDVKGIAPFIMAAIELESSKLE
jgi:unsaturated rhamnogalacturonyl hydrolase